MENADKRKDIRYTCTLNASYLVLGEPSRPQEMTVAKADVMDLSIGGIRLRNAQMLRKGSLVQVSVPVSGEHMVPVISEVRWAMQETPDRFQAGLKFLI